MDARWAVLLTLLACATAQECGTPTAEWQTLVLNGTSARHGELPWHAGIYTKRTTPYKQICGGSLVTTSVVISAAHCFCDVYSHLNPASDFAVALGKIYRPWSDSHDVGVQKFDVIKIKIPELFAGGAASFQDDIAVVVLSAPVTLSAYIRPVCIDFNSVFEAEQLQHSNIGKVAGWGLTETGLESQVLKTTELPYVKVKKCIQGLPPYYRPYLTSDKMCAGTKHGTALCKGDSGGGLTFPKTDGQLIERYYLRGVVSAAPRAEANTSSCNSNGYTTFTRVSAHEHFLVPYISSGTQLDEDGCAPLDPAWTTEKKGQKAWDKCIEYQRRLVYPCEPSPAPGGGMERARHCYHVADELVGSGANAAQFEFPHMVLLSTTNRTEDWTCGGTLISERFILTAAHCMPRRILLKPIKFAIVGCLRRSDDVSSSQVYQITSIFKHPGFNGRTKTNDIALLQTDRNIALGKTIVPACLDVFGGNLTIAVATGWGITDLEENKSDILQKVILTRFNESECNGLFASARYDGNKQFCYGDYFSARNTCLGDSGGPLTILNHKIHCMYTAVGVTSFGLRCGQRGVPGVYTKVAPFVPWIESIVWP